MFLQQVQPIISTDIPVCNSSNCNDLECPSTIASLFKWDFSYICAPVDKISTNKAYQAVL